MKTNHPTPHWRDELEAIQSLGSLDQGVAHMGELAAARERHLGQFWTPLELVALLWDIAGEAAGSAQGRRISLFDNSIGSARMFHFATPDRFSLYGCDVHAPTVKAVMEAAEAAGFFAQIEHAGMQDLRPSGLDVSLINPPFSLHLNSPNLEAFDCTSFGRFGPNASAQSDEYALAQALDAAQIVIAVVPASLAESVLTGGVVSATERSRLAAVLSLPASAFSAEGANVGTSVLVFDREPRSSVVRVNVDKLSGYKAPKLGLTLADAVESRPRIRVEGINDAEPVIERAVTGDRTVRIEHSGRQLQLHFKCGYTEARVLNDLYRERVHSDEHWRLPAGVRYAGQGLLDLHAILTTDDPSATFERLIQTINAAGGVAVPSDSVRGYLASLIRLKSRLQAPFGHWVYKKTAADVSHAAALKNIPLKPKGWVTPMIKVGEVMELHRDGNGWTVSKDGETLKFADEDVRRFFDLPSMTEGWTEVHPPLQRRFPALATQYEKRARALGLDKSLWHFQFDDLVECAMKPWGAIVGWNQGLGKARLSAALALVRGVRRALVVMPSYLLTEYTKRMDSAGFDRSMWQVIEKPADLDNLPTLSIISYERLRRPLHSGTKRTYAKALRNRIGMLLADEGERLCNTLSDQSRAVAQVNAKCVYILSGTPSANYPKNLLPLGCLTAGDGVVGQPFGVRHPMLNPHNAVSMRNAQRGVEVFKDRHVELVWSTNLYAEELQEGAKREIPRVRNVDGYRQWVSTFVKRRLPDEPQVCTSVQIPKAREQDITVPWNDSHLGYYLRVADEFAEWYRMTTPSQRVNNFMVLLSRINAVIAAANIPQLTPKVGLAWHGGMTTKQQAVLDLAKRFTREGHKTVVFADRPAQLIKFESELRAAGIDSVLFHGEIPTKVRYANLDTNWRYGETPILLATYGTLQAGFDLHQSDRAILANRSWSARTEDQAVARLLRPQQTMPVEVWRVHLQGSIDDYQAQMVRFKRESARAGLDWGEQQEDESFLHLDTLLGQFVDDLASLRGMNHYDLRSHMKEAA